MSLVSVHLTHADQTFFIPAHQVIQELMRPDGLGTTMAVLEIQFTHLTVQILLTIARSTPHSGSCKTGAHSIGMITPTGAPSKRTPTAPTSIKLLQLAQSPNGILDQADMCLTFTR